MVSNNFVQRLKKGVESKNEVMNDAAEKLRSVVHDLEQADGGRGQQTITELKYIIIDLENNANEIK